MKHTAPSPKCELTHLLDKEGLHDGQVQGFPYPQAIGTLLNLWACENASDASQKQFSKQGQVKVPRRQQAPANSTCGKRASASSTNCHVMWKYRSFNLNFSTSMCICLHSSKFSTRVRLSIPDLARQQSNLTKNELCSFTKKPLKIAPLRFRSVHARHHR